MRNSPRDADRRPMVGWGRPRPVMVTEFGGPWTFKPWYDPSGACPKNCSFFSGEGEGYSHLAGRVLGWTMANLADPGGYFYFQKDARRTNRIPYMRWSQAWMFRALTAWTAACVSGLRLALCPWPLLSSVAKVHFKTTKQVV